MKKALIVMSALAICFVGGVTSRSARAAVFAKTWKFSTDIPGNPPTGFIFARTGDGRPGRWIVISSAKAGQAENVLAQMDADTTDYRFPMAIAESPVVRDLRLSVRCAPVAGKVDRACGIVFRYQDENDYYVARANALEDNVRFYRVRNGRREQLGTWDGKVASGTWHELQADARGDRFVITWDGKTVIDTRDGTFPGAGKIGVWTKADSVTYFEDLTLESPGP